MELIDKSALIAEIKRIRDKAFPNSEWNHGYAKACESIISLLDTLEVKEVDLDEIANHEDIKNAFKAGYELGLKNKKSQSGVRKMKEALMKH